MKLLMWRYICEANESSVAVGMLLGVISTLLLIVFCMIASPILFPLFFLTGRLSGDFHSPATDSLMVLYETGSSKGKPMRDKPEEHSYGQN